LMFTDDKLALVECPIHAQKDAECVAEQTDL
jgi:hypothetical protein